MSAFDDFIEDLNDPDTDIRSKAIGGLGLLGDLRAVEPLLLLLEYTHQEPQAYWAYASAWSLGRLKDRRAVDPLIKALSHPEPSMMVQAVIALGQIGDQKAVQPLINMLLKHNEDFVRRYIAIALGNLRNADAVEPLLTTLHKVVDDGTRFSQHENTKGFIVQALGEIGDKRAVDTLIALLDTEDGNVACYAAKALGEIGDSRAVEPLLRVLQHPWGRAWVRPWAAEALGKFRDERALQPLIDALKDDNVRVRIGAAKGLMFQGDVRALPALDQAKQEDDGMDDDTGETVKWAATRARRSIRHITRRSQDN